MRWLITIAIIYKIITDTEWNYIREILLMYWFPIKILYQSKLYKFNLEKFLTGCTSPIIERMTHRNLVVFFFSLDFLNSKSRLFQKWNNKSHKWLFRNFCHYGMTSKYYMYIWIYMYIYVDTKYCTSGWFFYYSWICKFMKICKVWRFGPKLTI